MADLDFDLVRLHAAYAAGLSPVEVIEQVFKRLAEADDPGIFIAIHDRETLMAMARALPPFDAERYPLWGVPFAIKDNIDLAGLPTTAACPAFAYRPERSATVVERLVAAGALPVGKTNLDQFATGLVGVRTPYPVPLNPFDPAVVPGGSSSGSGVAVARGIVSFALGTDTAGSGRVPAALNNVVGLKPSLGLLSTRGVVPACRTLDCVSVFALTVADAVAITSVAAGYDADDPFSRPVPFQPEVLTRPSVRLGVPDAASRRFFGDVNAEAAFDASLALAEDAGARLVPVDMSPLFAVASLLYDGPWVAERYAGARDFLSSDIEALLPVTRRIISGAGRFSAVDAFVGRYRLAALAREAAPLWQEIDALMVPSIPGIATIAELETDPIGPNSRLGTYTNFVNLLDLCALAVPGPFRGDGLPAGVTLIAPAGRDGFLAPLGAALHARAATPLGATGRPQPDSPAGRTLAPAAAAPASAVSASGPLIELGVVGAHLSGMPLNGELTSRGGQFVRGTHTGPHYRLYALARQGQGAQRPGLLRVGPEEGEEIALEIWALPPAGFADFVAKVPAPLTIGSVRLADGSAVPGFLCEAIGVHGALDITGFGGWRAYVQATTDA
ncbi:allophanate hydrolase [Pseudoxanthobacter soli DSM 19599]|uniref:Allophanate hydrolase n=1 Tax=Pseudoxanthobacter soli DSM 19599 TaxID=1123029 RepID=A0A1M7ZL96_9HYPH|nr:allophanate hydrolase [Pseudoxanthobacter soli]SHO65664.1 allophanate hydrolase [Pseudoxanthobacter soli DSM 19599]